jgi:NAD(P)-dependent dehydrogenase (short-subunit alcohol dehydrogenase family)
MKVDISNRVAVVTGAAGLIGRSTALALADGGAIIAVNDLRSPEEISNEIRTRGGVAHPFQADISDPGAVEAMIYQIESEIGAIDILANCATVQSNGGRFPIHEFSDEEWQETFRVDLDSVFYCSRSVSTRMIQRRKGAIVNISSAFGLVPARFQCAHAAAKAGVISFTRSHALEVGPYGIRVNGVAPGLILSEVKRSLFDLPENKQRADSLLSHIPLGVPGDSNDIAAAVLYLVSDSARNVTGQILAVDGGWTAGFCRDW